MYKCPSCGNYNRIVNECRCDPNNLPTRIAVIDEALETIRDLARTGTAPEALPEVFLRGDGKGWGFIVFVKGAVPFVAFAWFFQLYPAGADYSCQVNGFFDALYLFLF